MKGVILSGGLGTRMGYYTHRVTNKHLIYVYNRAMIEYPLSSLVEAGVRDIVVVSGGRYGGAISDYLGNGKEFGCLSINYARQHGEGGIAAALDCARPFCGGDDPVCVILGDNLFQDSLSSFVGTYGGVGGKILLKEVPDPTSFGVATISENDGKVLRVVEKPRSPESNLAIVGAYIFDSDVFNVIKTLKPSARGELEVTDLIQHYMSKDQLEYTKLEGYWTDMGSPESLLDAANFIRANPLARLNQVQVDPTIPVSLSQLEDWYHSAIPAVEAKGGKHLWLGQIKNYISMLEKWKLK